MPKGYYATNYAYTTAAASTWHAWTTTGTGAAYCTDTTTSGGAVWGYWNDADCTYQITTATATYKITAAAAWNDWALIEDARVRKTTRLLRHSTTAREQTPAELEALRIQRVAAIEATRVQVAENEKKLAQQREAAAVAERLMLENLDEAQRAEYRLGKSFMVRGSKGNLYRIRHGTHGNLDMVDARTGKIVRRLCVYAVGVPACDSMLAQKLLLEACEEMLTNAANASDPLTQETVTVPERMKGAA